MLYPCFRVVALAAVFAGIVSAEVALSGRVVDDTDAPVASARLIFTPSSGNQTFRTSAAQSGVFTISVPAPGDYFVTVQREGYFELTKRPVKVEPNPSQLTFVLSPVREVFQTLDVNDAPSPVDIDNTDNRSSLTGTEIVDIPYPVTHSLRNATRLLPGVVQDQKGGIHFQGASENQVQYALNGFNISDPITGQFRTRLSVEAARTLDFTSARMSPEYGKGSAGVLNIRTDSGTDQFRYTATNFIPGVDFRNGLHVGDWSPRLGLSGPIWRGKAWFSDSFDGGYNQSIINGLPNSANRSWDAAGSNLLHTQVNITPTNILFSDYLINVDHQSRLGLGPLDPASTTTTQRIHNSLWSVKDQVAIERFVFEAGYAENRVSEDRIPQGTQLYTMSPFGRSGNYFVDSTQDAIRRQLIGNTFFPSFLFFGKHLVKAGIDYDALQYNATNTRTGYRQIGESGELLSKTVYQGGGPISVPNRQFSSYVADSWQLREDLQVEYGIRQDWDRLAGDTIYSPRVAFSYAPFRTHRTKFSGGYARTADNTYLELFGRTQDQYAVTTQFNPDGTVSAGPYATVFVIPPHHFQIPRANNWTASVDHQLASRTFAGVNFIRRRTGRGLTYVAATPPPGLEIDAIPVGGYFNLTNLRRDSYDSVEVSIRQSLAAQFEWMVSYTWSRAASNAVLDLNVDQPLQVASNLGRLPWDSPHRLLSWGYLPIVGVPLMRKDWALSWLADARTGFPFSVQDEFGRIIGTVNAHRYPMNFDLNLHLERRFVYRGYRFALRGGVNNITNQRNPTAVNNIFGSSQFLQFFGDEGRHVVLRIRFFGRA